MLAKSSKSRLAAMALMALGVSTFMGTSAALATGVDVSGSVACTATSSTVSASAVAIGAVAPGVSGSANLTPAITQGKNTNCSDKNATVTASIGTFTGQADTSVLVGNRVGVSISTLGEVNTGVFTVTASVPGTAVAGDFGATVTLSLSGS